ncbi:MAG: hypothetical protein ACRDIV_13885 [Ktedonobacteraceae bacterium]
MDTRMKIAIFLMLFALFGLVVGILELLKHGFIASSWYCVLIGGVAVFFLFLSVIDAMEGASLWGRFLFFSMYLLLLSILYRISSSILFGGVANIIIVLAITLFVVTILFIGTFSSGTGKRRTYYRR